MKKLLTALCLCLALCLLCGMALAEAPEEEREYTHKECVDGIPGVLRCFYGEDEEGNKLYDDKPMTAEDRKNFDYHNFVDSVVVDWGVHEQNEDGSIKVIEPYIWGLKCSRCGDVVEYENENAWAHKIVEGSMIEYPATCVAPAHRTFVCEICGLVDEEYGEPDGMNHSWVQANDEKTGKPIITKATCEKSGEKTMVCEYCGATKVMEIAPRDHVWGDTVYEWDFVKGTLSAVQHCQNTETDEYEACKAVKVLETVKATGKLVDEDDCTKGRNWTAEKFTDKDLEKNSPKTTTEEIKEHKFSAPEFTWTEAKEWDDPNDKYTVKAAYKCTVCTTKGEEEVKATATLKADTLCTAADKATYTATFSDTWVTKWGADKKNADAYKTATVRVEPLAHKFEQVGDIEWSKDNSKATLEYRCTREDCPLSKADKKGKYQTLTIDTVRTEDNTVPCTDENRVEWKADFSSIIPELVETKNGAIEHDWDKPRIEKYGKNCEDVNVMVKFCKHCRLAKVSVRYEEPVAPVYANEPDETFVKKIFNEKADGTYCYEEETTEVYYCVNCGGFHWNWYNLGTEWESGEKTEEPYPEHIKTVVTSKLVKEHNFELQKDDENAATCTEGGTQTFICKDCGYVKTVEVDALGHTWGEWKLVHAVGENGGKLAYWTRKCEVCDEIDPLIIDKNELTCEDLKEEHTFGWAILEGEHVYQCTKCGVVENKEIPDDVHVWPEEPEITAATCLEDGKKVWTCEVCGATKEEVIKAAGKHTPGKEQIVAKATCEADGLIAVTCTVCSEVLETKTIPATGHTAGDPVITAATCTEAGKEEIPCSVCGAVISTKEIPALGHKTEVLAAKAATCTEDGLTEGEKCTVCGEIIKAQETIKAEGHKSDEGTVTKEATVDAKGEKVYKCTVCGEVLKTEEIDFVPKAASYTLEDLSIENGKISAKIAHDPESETVQIYARITVYTEDQTFFSMLLPVSDEINSFVSGNWWIVTIELTADNSVVPGEYTAMDSDFIER